MSDFIKHFIKKDILKEGDISKIEEESQKRHISKEEALFRLKILLDEIFLKEYANFYHLPYEDNPENVKCSDMLPIKFLEDKGIAIMPQENNTLLLFKSDPFDVEIEDQIEFITEMKVNCILSPPDLIKDAINRIASADILKTVRTETHTESIDEKEENIFVDELISQPPIIRLVNIILIDAIKFGASDVHIEPQNNKMVVRFRVDGHLHVYNTFSKQLVLPVISRIKVLANLDIAVKRKPQDGSISLKFENRDIDLRVSTLPSIHGEKCVIRVLDKERLHVNLEKLGFSEHIIKTLNRIIHRPSGILLVSGPTGSGKTTTLYAILNELKSEEVNIVTIEDPVEYKIEGITQTSIHPQSGLTFATALRSILRQDPDIILVGEIRDAETAKTAVEAALTGHLVLSTVHTNDALSVIFRFKNMGIEPDMLADSLIGVLSQRLVRKVCMKCAVQEILKEDKLKEYGIEGKSLTQFRGQGCKECLHTGYKGRTPIAEIIEIDDELRNLIIKDFSREEAMNILYKKQFIPITEDAINKVKEFITTLDEVANAVNLQGVVLDNTEDNSTEEKSILIVDDSPTIRAMIKPLFEMNNFKVYEAENGKECINKLKTLKPSLIVMDLMMPEMNGFETIQIIRSNDKLKDIPVIMMTTESEMTNELKGLELGVDEFIAKPFMPERLLARSMAILRRTSKDILT